MKNLKILFCLFFLLSIGSTNVWGAVNEGEEYSWNSSTKTLTIHKAGDFADGIIGDYGVTTNKPEWKDSYSDEAIKIIIADGITTIGTQNFNNFSKLQTIVLPASLATIKQGAFASCPKLQEVLFKGSPDEWASIDFQSSDANYHSYPFSTSTAETRKFAFYYTSGSASESVNIVLTSAISQIKPYAFYKATNVVDVYIPGTITTIGNHAIDCSITNLYVNKKKAPGTGTTSISWKKTGTTLYVPEGATSSYKSKPYYNSTSESTTGAKNIGASSDYSGIRASGIGGTGNTYKMNGNFDNIAWSLDTTGTLLLYGTGSISTNYSGTSFGSSINLPWGRFRRLVNKVIIRPNGEDIADLNTIIKYAYALNSIVIEQTSIPTCGVVATNGSTSFDALFDQSKNVVLKIKPASLTNASASRLGSAPWNDAKLDIQLSDDLVIDQASGDNSTILTNCSTYVEKPVNVQLTRSTLSSEMYNTFCSPVNMTEAEVTAMFGAETELVEFDGTEIKDGVLNLKFKKTTSITAGTPYLIQPAVAVSNPTFTDVNPASIATSGSIAEVVGETHADFYGTLAPVEVSSDYAENKNFIFLLADNKLTYATGGTLKGMRAYFLLKKGTPSSVMAKRPVLQISNGENTTTDLGQVPSDKIQCTKVLRDGQIYILRGEKAYNLQGIEIDRPNKL